MMAISSQIKLVSQGVPHEPDKKVVQAGRLHPSRLMHLGEQSGLLTMDNEERPHVTAIAYIVVLLIAALVVGAYLYGHSQGRLAGKDEGQKDAQLQQLTKQIESLQDDKAQDERDAERIRKAQEAIKEK